MREHADDVRVETPRASFVARAHVVGLVEPDRLLEFGLLLGREAREMPTLLRATARRRGTWV